MQRRNPSSTRMLKKSLSAATTLKQAILTLVTYFRMSNQADRNEASSYVASIFLLNYLSFAFTYIIAADASLGCHDRRSKAQYAFIAALVLLSAACFLHSFIICHLDKNKETALKAGVVGTFGTLFNNVLNNYLYASKHEPHEGDYCNKSLKR